MRRVLSVGVLLALCSIPVLAGVYLMNDTGETVYGLRVEFSEPVTITGFGDVLATVEPTEESTEFTFTGGALEAWGGHWFNWKPASAVITENEWLSSPAHVEPIGFADFPTQLQALLDERASSMKPRDACIAGRVRLSIGETITGCRDVHVEAIFTLQDGGRWHEPMETFEGGWFVMSDCVGREATVARVDFRAFGFDPLTLTIDVSRDHITYVGEVTLEQTPEDRTASIEVHVDDSSGLPLTGARIRFSPSMIGYLARCGAPSIAETTNDMGICAFKGLSPMEYRIYVEHEGYESANTVVTASAVEQHPIVQLVLFPQYRVVIDYVYQPSGSTRLSGGDVIEGSFEWRADYGFYDFDIQAFTGGCPSPDRYADLKLVQEGNRLSFQRVCSAQFLDLGQVNFESVQEAVRSGYSSQAVECTKGHVYLIHTDKDRYAKILVRSVSGS